MSIKGVVASWGWLILTWEGQACVHRIHTSCLKPTTTGSIYIMDFGRSYKLKLFYSLRAGCISIPLLPNKSLLKYEVGSSNEIRWWQLNQMISFFFLFSTSCPSFAVFAKRIQMWQWRVYPSCLCLWPRQWLWRQQRRAQLQYGDLCFYAGSC